MNIVVSNKSEKPLYEQIYECVSAEILSGELPADTCLPSIRVVARELNISVITVKKAWEQLEWNGFIYTRAGKGCFVAPQRQAADTRRRQLAEARLKEAVPYLRSLGLTADDAADIVRDLFDRTQDKDR